MKSGVLDSSRKQKRMKTFTGRSGKQPPEVRRKSEDQENGKMAQLDELSSKKIILRMN